MDWEAKLSRQLHAVETTKAEITAFERLNKNGAANKIIAALNTKLTRQNGAAEITRTAISLLSKK